MTIRDQTEWMEEVGAGPSQLVGAVNVKMVEVAGRNFGCIVEDIGWLYGSGGASQRVVNKLLEPESS